jgi:hypothetical protein
MEKLVFSYTLFLKILIFLRSTLDNFSFPFVLRNYFLTLDSPPPNLLNNFLNLFRKKQNTLYTMADSPTDFVIKDFSVLFKNINPPNPQDTPCSQTIDKNCINYKIYENKIYTEQIRDYLSKASAGNENHENTKAKYYNQYMNLVNMGVGTIGLIYYIYFFMKTQQ